VALNSVDSFEEPNPRCDNRVEAPSFCVLLKKTRERQGLSIEQVCHALKIRKFFIEAIEAGDFDKLPGMVYTAGFIQSYCKLLKIDLDVAKKALQQIDGQCDISPATSFQSTPPVTAFSPWIMGTSLIVSLVLIMGFLAFRSDFLKVNPKPVLTVPSSFTPAHAEFNLDILKESLVTFYALDQTWIQLADAKGKIIETRLLSPGEVYQIARQPGLYLTTGNGQALKVYDGRQALTLPDSSQASLPPLVPENSDLLENYPLTEP
jgi:hypothetical protein